ncbi:MAG: divergent polysaccharide deacetylase family protein [Alphaproteobacteria bacterium]|nr:divergent polysaccharide deacetylase family protein [Alphaproteobacteria bacterium]
MSLKALPDLDLKGFAAGAAGGFFVIFCLAVFAGIQSGKTTETLQELMVSRMVVLEKPQTSEPQPEIHAEVSHEEHVEKVEAVPPEQPHEESAAEPEASEETSSSDKASFPLSGLTEKTSQGLLPVIRKSDGLTPFKAYARPYKRPSTLPRVAVVVIGYGLKEDYSVQALGLPADVTLLISPYSAQPARWQQKAWEKNHELWLGLPMEANSFGNNDPGPRAISSIETLEQNETRLNGILAQAAGYAGVAGFYTERFKAAGLTIQALFADIFGRGLGYLELNPAPPSTIAEVADKKGAPYVQGVINLGDERFISHMDDAFEIAEGLALDKKTAIIIVPAYPKVLDAVNAWQKTLPAKGIVVAPLSAMASKGH